MYLLEYRKKNVAAQLSCLIRVTEEILSQTWPTTTGTVGLLSNYTCESQVEDLSDPDNENNDYYAAPCKQKIVLPKKWRDKY